MGGKETLTMIASGMASRCIHLLIAAALIGFGASGRASNSTEVECFDADVSATILRQTPTVIPECEDCIIMRWPWLVDLRVRRVQEGLATRGDLTVLNVQHTYYRTDLGPRRWLLRRNTLGGFNVVVPSEEGRLPRCSESALPAPPYIQPADGTTLDDVRREGEARYGRHR
jgi:hypothetical protein